MFFLILVVSVWSLVGEKITLVMRVRFVIWSGVSRGAKILHTMKSSRMLFTFSPFKGQLCALAQGWGAHVSVIFLPCLPLRAGGRASMRFPRSQGDMYGLSLGVERGCSRLSNVANN